MYVCMYIFTAREIKPEHTVSAISLALQSQFPFTFFVCFLGFRAHGYFEGNTFHLFLICFP